MVISDDKKSAQISINKTFTAPEIETLISELAVIRANMLPPIPFEPPKATDPDIDSSHVTEQDEPHVQVKLLKDNRIRIWLRSWGLGWMAFNLTQENACIIRDYLIANTPDNRDADFFRDQGSHGDALH